MFSTIDALAADTMKYPFNSQNAPDRTHSGGLKGMVQTAQLKEPVCGIKGPSTLIKLQGLDLVWGLPPDYMHCVWEGMTKKVIELWLSCTGSSWYIGRHLKFNCGCKITFSKATHNFVKVGTALVRSVILEGCWMALSAFILVLSVMMHTSSSIRGAFCATYTSSLFLLKDIVTEAQICAAENLLLAFVQQTAKLYGESAMTFNMH